MNRAFTKTRASSSHQILLLLIVAAVICAGRSASAFSKTAQQSTVDNESATASGEHLLYSKVIDSYRAQQLGDLNRAVDLMLKAYPKSVHTDNALYLKSDLLLAKGQYQNSLDTIDLLLKNFPSSNKRVSALYLKSQALKQAKQTRGSEVAAQEVQKRYPGSIEAAKLYSQRTLQQ